VSFRALLAATYLHLFDARNVVDAFVGLPRRGDLRSRRSATASPEPCRLCVDPPSRTSATSWRRSFSGIRLSLRTTMQRVSQSWLAIASGLSIGREGPLIELRNRAPQQVG
jgi:hypothetical protein